MNDRFIQEILIDWDKIEQGSYLRGIPALKGISRLEFSRGITFFVGENGTGTSTLLEAIAVAYGFNPEGGTKNYRFETYNDVSELSTAVRIVRGYKRPKGSYFFRAESFFNLATKAEEYDRDNPRGTSFGARGLHNQSHGESFLSFFQTFHNEGIYILDEPEAALSPQRQLTLFIQIAKMAEEGAQFIIASHSPILLGLPGAAIWSFDGGEVHECEYEDTESYQVTRMFINNREALVRKLLE
ncbi:MAG: AAA family ATPase [Lachnospiraceae bacterium]|nr:AAA family ATPase [Lachnospiraceae bacterium]